MIWGIKLSPHFENLLHTFAMQYKIKVQVNIQIVCLLSRKPWFSAVCERLRKENGCVFFGLLNETFEYWNSGVVWTLLNNRLLLKGITFAKMYDTSRQEPFYIKITWLPNLTDVIFIQVQQDCGRKFFTTKSYACNKKEGGMHSTIYQAKWNFFASKSYKCNILKI